MGKKLDIIGNTYTMKSGEVISVIACRGAKDVDVQFSDGAIRTGVQFEHIKRRSVKHPNCAHKIKEDAAAERVGETRTMKCGLEAKIVAYRNSGDIDVAFGEHIITGKQYSHFKTGNIAPPEELCPNATKIVLKSIYKGRRKTQPTKQSAAYRNLRDERVGLVECARNGMLMEIIDYLNTDNIIVRFEDGVEVATRYAFFKDGLVKHPTMPSKRWGISFPEIIVLYYLSKIGFKKYNMGYFRKFNQDFNRMELDVFNEELMYAVEYDGRAYHNTEPVIQHDILKEELCTKSGIRLIKIRESGLPMEAHPNAIIRERHWDNAEMESILQQIVADINAHCGTNFTLDIDIRRDKLEIIEMFSTYKALQNERVGLTSVATNGMEITIIGYARSDNLTVQFEDGEVVSGITYRRFMDGRVAHPSKRAESRIGEEITSKHGEVQRIVKYNSTDDVDVLCDNGDMICHVSYKRFKSGRLVSNKYKEQARNEYVRSKIGEKSVNMDGIEMEIIDYINHNNLTVKFATGEIREHVHYHCFAQGSVKAVQRHNAKKKREGEEHRANNGQMLKIINYRNSASCDVEFEDGTIVKNCTYASILSGTVRNPNVETRDVKNQEIAGERLNEVHYNKRGERMVIIAYNTSRNVTVRFDDGTERSGLSYQNVRQGKVLKPHAA